MFIKMFVFLVLAGFSIFANADTYPSVTLTQWLGKGVWYFDQSQACTSKTINGYVYSIGSVVNPYTCKVVSPSGVTSYESLSNQLVSNQCPGGGTPSGSNCINAPACTTGVRLSSGLCPAAPVYTVCTAQQNPVKDSCTYPTNQGVPVNCIDGSVVYVPSVCPSQGGKWQDIFPAPKPLCLPNQTDHSTCEPLLFQRIDDWASSQALQIGTALLMIAAPELAVAGTAIAEVASALAADFPMVWRNSAGEIVDTVIRADVPKAEFGQAVTDLIKNNPSDPYVQSLPNLLGGPSGPVTINSSTGAITPSGSTVPYSLNQVSDVVRSLNAVKPIPLDKVATYIVPERIPWLNAAQTAVKFDLSTQAAPQFFPKALAPATPVAVSTPEFIRVPSPLSVVEPTAISRFPPSFATVNALSPLATLTPLSPNVYTPTATIYAPTVNPNPTGSPLATAPSSPPPPNVPIDPLQVDLPPTPPDLFDDKFKYFDFLPTNNPFDFDPGSFLPSMPTSACNYEIHQVVNVPFMGPHAFNLAPCVPLQPLRTVLAWAFSVLTAWLTFILLFKAEV